ncbi:hypothetical protein [Hydrocarboniphaga sp.]|uniref:hypothetical protein n=1 Tax=Hydrocarboniphaga sp. TaxID=2033016 RepID=UPI003D13BC1E
MIIDTSENLAAEELVSHIVSGVVGHQYGHFSARYDVEKKVVRTKLPADKAQWVLNQVPASRHLAISCSTFIGKDVLPNVSSTNVLTVELNVPDKLLIRTPRHLLTTICEHLSRVAIPAPSALICTTQNSLAIWALDRSFEYDELGELYAVECGLAEALQKFGATTSPQSASRYLPLPRPDGVGRAVALIGNGALTTSSSKRLIHVTGDYVSSNTAKRLNRNIEVISELGALLFKRFIDVSAAPEKYWLWMAAYAAASGYYVSHQELRDITRSIVESLERCTWDDARTRKVPTLDYNYENYLDVLVRNVKAEMVRLGPRAEDYYSIQDGSWTAVVAANLSVTLAEIEELRNL